MDVFYSRHARERMVLRGISTQLVEDAIKRGSKEIIKGNKIISHYKYFSVVYEVRKADVYVITIQPR